MDNLEVLHRREMEVFKMVSSLHGTTQEKQALLVSQSIPQMYNDIFEEYSFNNANPAAHKRAAFIQWYAVSEPVVHTGIGNLNEVFQKSNVDHLRSCIETQSIDVEFQTMLLHYYKISDWYFNSYMPFEPLIKVILSWNNRHNYLDIPVMKRRGQMGIYWNSIR